MRLASWLDRAGSNERALTAMIEHKGGVYSQLRTDRGYGAGMKRQAARPLFYQYIEMRIDPADDFMTSREYLGLTLNRDIQPGDIIRMPRYDGGFDGLAVQSVRWLGSVAQVELRYGS